MNSIILGAASFLGTNLAVELSKDENNSLTLVDCQIEYFKNIQELNLPRTQIIVSPLANDEELDELLKNRDVLYYLVSSNVPATSNCRISSDVCENLAVASRVFDACVRANIKKIVFLSSGGTVYGKAIDLPFSESHPTDPICSYGLQKLSIEKMLYLYNCVHGIDYRIIRLANPYGPHQRPNGILGAATTFVYKAMTHQTIVVYGDGSVVRDFIYIDDAVKAILNIVNGTSEFRTFNVGSGYGTSINELLSIVKETVGCDIKIEYTAGRPVDVPANYLDISRYEKCYGKLATTSLQDGIKNTMAFMKKEMN